MPLCAQCGSIQITRAHGTLFDKIAGVLTTKRPFICRRCGWRGRRRWTDEDFHAMRNYGMGGAEVDSELSVLDDPPSERHSLARGRERTSDVSAAKPHGFDLNEVPFGDDGIQSSISHELPHDTWPSRQKGARASRRGNRERRREIRLALAVSGLLMITAFLLSNASACSALRSFS